MADNVQIRLATISDAEAIQACATEAYAQYVAAIGQKPAPMVADFPALIAKGVTYVAVGRTDEVLGYVIFFPKEGDIHLENLAVRSATTGQGIGKALIQFCEAEGRRIGARAVTLYTNVKMVANLSIYPHLGYVETDRRHESGFDRVFFEKLL